MHKKRVLITGINGFVGSKLELYLAKKYDIWGLDLANVNNYPNFIASDITNENKIKEDLKDEKFDIVIHCAALAHNDNNEFSDQDFFNINANGTKFLLAAFNDAPPSKFIMFSTVAVYGEYGSILPVNESAALNPITAYAKSKVLAEEYCNNSEICTQILRFPAIYSETLLKDFSKRILKKSSVAFKFGNGEQKHTFCHLDSVFQQVAFVLDLDEYESQILQMGDDFNYSSIDILKYFKPELKYIIPFPKIVFRTIIQVLSIVFYSRRESFKTVYWKLYKNNLYSIKYLLEKGYKPVSNKIV